jgi:uncharacterized protein (TIGR03435 family)
MRYLALIAILAVGNVAVFARPQDSAARAAPSFEVASIKPSAPIVPGPDGSITMMTRPGSPMPGGRWVAANASLMIILRQIYPEYRQPNQIVGAPDWVTRERFDINAKADGERSREEMTVLVKQLLADRFKLKTHIEKREVDVYSLVLARSDGRLGAGLRKPAYDCVAMNAARARGEAIPAAKPGERAPCQLGSFMDKGQMRLSLPGSTMTQLAGMLQSNVGRPVIDRTGLTDRYDIDVLYAFSNALSVSADTDSGPSIFSAVQEQLGLKLEAGRQQSEVLVIDQVERPSPD